MKCLSTGSTLSVLLLGILVASAADLDELKVKREAVFEFAQKPAVTRAGDNVTATFETKAFCDVTVAVEDANGRIIRHLASGVLGPKAPPPLQKNSKKQTIVWDGKNDQDVYVDDKDSCTLRISLGLKPQFERTLFWSPKKRIGFSYPSIRAAPEGVYYGESCDLDQVRLFDHSGTYVRTVYPFPADQVNKVQGLKMHTFVQNGKSLPLKRGYCQATLLTSSGSDQYGAAGINAVAASAGRVAVVNLKMNRLAPDGSSGGLPFEGPGVAISLAQDACGFGHKAVEVAPLSAVISPDGKWLYLAGYEFGSSWGGNMDWMNGVWRMPYGENTRPALFVGTDKPGVKNGGSDNGQFKMATSVACDAQGRVYVSDYMNDRVQVFDDAGKHLKSIPVAKPASVSVHQKTGDIYVFSWLLANRLITTDQFKVDPAMTHLGPLDNPAVKLACPLPMLNHQPTLSWNVQGGVQHRVELNSWTEKPTIWLLNGKVGSGWAGGTGWDAAKELSEQKQDVWSGSNIRVFEESDGKLVARQDFASDVIKAVVRQAPPILWRQRLYVNPLTGKLYVAEGDSGVMKSVNQLVEIAPETGKIKLVELPLGAEDLCFDLNGLAYIRTDTLVGRYDPTSWREVPWDYGEEKKGHSYGMGARGADLIAALPTPGHRSFAFWHLGGIDISPKGDLVVTTCNGSGMDQAPAKARHGDGKFEYKAKEYVPDLYPGRARWGEVHIWDKHGKLLAQDVVPGMTHLNGIGMDSDRNIYMLSASRRNYDDKASGPLPELASTCTLLRMPARKAKVVSSSGSVPVPLPPEGQPKRPQDLLANCAGVSGWVEGADWFFGGVGFGAGGCVCWNSRFDLDDFGRSFAPEHLHCSVAVLDSAGNVITRVGSYGNVDDGKPLELKGGPAEPRSIGGDEVALMYACYVASHTDRRLFIADAGNSRILSVKLGYNAEEKIGLKDVKDSGKK